MTQFIVISYDIGDDKRRTKIMKALEDYGARVQYSVFECHLERPHLARLKRRLRPLVRDRQDSIRFYYLDADDVARIEVLGSGSVTPERTFFLQ